MARLELGFADLGAVRARQRRVGKILEGPAGALGAGAGRKVRDDRPHAGRLLGHSLSFQTRRPSLGRGVPLAEIGELRDRVNVQRR